MPRMISWYTHPPVEWYWADGLAETSVPSACHQRHSLVPVGTQALINTVEGATLGHPGDSPDVTQVEAGWARMGHPGIR